MGGGRRIVARRKKNNNLQSLKRHVIDVYQETNSHVLQVNVPPMMGMGRIKTRTKEVFVFVH